MAEQKFKVNCGFFNSVNHDRLYASEDMNRPYRRVVGNGVFATQFGEPSTDLQVFTASDGMNIIVKKGEGIFNNKWFENPTDLIITAPKNNSIIPRIDSIIVRVDMTRNNRDGSIVYVEGIENENPTPPSINTNEDIIEYRLANINIAPGTNTILQENITDCRGSSECLWVTGLIKQVDTSTLFVQYQEWYKRVTGEAEVNLENLQQQFEEDLENFMNSSSNNFNTWLENLQNTLDGDTAGNLLNLINEVKQTKSDKKKTYTIQIDTNWTEGSKTIQVQGIQETDIVNLSPIWSEDKETRLQEKEEYNKISMIKSQDNAIQIICDEETPQMTLNVRLEVFY